MPRSDTATTIFADVNETSVAEAEAIVGAVSRAAFRTMSLFGELPQEMVQ